MGEADVGGFFEDQGDATAPCFDELNAAEEVGDKGIAAAGDLGGFKGPQGDAFHEGSWVADFDAIREDGDADFIGVAVVAVAEGIDDGFAECLAVDLGDVDANETVESHADANVLEDDRLDFLGGELPILIGDAHVGTAMGVVGFLAAGETDADARFIFQDYLGDFRIDLRLDVGGDGLRDFAQGGFGYFHADGATVVSDPKPKLATAMLVENGGHGIESFAEFGEALFVFDGFGFLHVQAWEVVGMST